MIHLDAVFESRSRGDIKRAGAWLDGEGRDQRAALVARAAARGAVIPEDWQEMPGKKLVRLCLARATEAQVRTNPIHRDEAFTCLHCGRDVPPGGRRPRDHCPWCLHSLHVDVVPGDRAAGCDGTLVPIAVDLGDLVYRCARCGAVRRNRILDDLDPPDDPSAIAACAARAATIPASTSGAVSR